MKFTYLKFKKEDFWFLFICFLGKSANLRLRKLRTTFGYGLKVERYKGKMKTLVALPALPGPKISKNTFKSFNSWQLECSPASPVVDIGTRNCACAHILINSQSNLRVKQDRLFDITTYIDYRNIDWSFTMKFPLSLKSLWSLRYPALVAVPEQSPSILKCKIHVALEVKVSAEALKLRDQLDQKEHRAKGLLFNR